MKVETVIEPRISKRTKKNKLIIALILSIDLFFNTMLPFAIGVYFGVTKNLLFLVIFIFLLLFHIKIEYKDEIRIKIIRGL